MSKFSVIGYSNQIIGEVDAVDASDAWSKARKSFSEILDVRQVGTERGLGNLVGGSWRYVITPRGIAENASLRGKISRWLDGQMWEAFSPTKEASVLTLFAAHPGGLTVRGIRDKQLIDPSTGEKVSEDVIERTCRELERRGLIEKV